MKQILLGLMLGLTVGIMIALATLIYTGSRLNDARAEAYDRGKADAGVLGEHTRQGISARLNQGLMEDLNHMEKLMDGVVEALREIDTAESLEAAKEQAKAALKALEPEDE
jgi:hypothetical protein